jgi:LysM repeat protein
MWSKIIQNVTPIRRAGAVSVLAIMAASCASQAGQGRNFGESSDYRPVNTYDAAPARYENGTGIEAARDAHRRFSSYRAEQLDGDCESRVTVNRGETLSNIAEFCDVSVSSLLDRNPQIHDANRVFTNEQIFIPIASANVYAGDTRGRQSGNVRYQDINLQTRALGRDGDRDYYVVRRGDTLAEIAGRHNATLNDVMRFNPTLQPRNLAIGERVYLPAYSVRSTTADDNRRRDAAYNTSAPRISISPEHGTRAGDIRLVGDYFQQGEQLSVLYGDRPDSLVHIRTIQADSSGRIDERVGLPAAFDRDLAYFAIQRGSDTYMSQSYTVDGSFPPNTGNSHGDSGVVTDTNYNGPYPLTDTAALIAVNQDVYWGDKVTLVAHSFPPNTPVSIYVGPNRNALIKIAETRTGPNGVFQTQVEIPDTVNSDAVIFVAAVEDGSRTYFSDEVRIRTDDNRGRVDRRREIDSSSSSAIDAGVPYRTAAPTPASPRALDRGADRKSGNVASRLRNSVLRDDVSINSGGQSAVSGVLTNEGVACPALRDDAGRLYTLLGDLQGFVDGDRVLVSGSSAVDRRICGQSETIQVFSIAKAPW